MTKQLTATGIEKMKAGPDRREIREGSSGLILIIHPSGAKSFAMRFRRPDGTPAKLTLGAVDLNAAETTEPPEIGMPLSLKAGRQLAAEVNRRRAMGRDVVAELAAMRRKRQVEIETEAYTFPAAVRQFVAEHARKNRGWRATARVLGLDYSDTVDEPQEIKGSLASRWSDRAISTIDGHDVFAAIDEARRRGIPGLGRYNDGISDARGRSVARALGKLFAWLLQHRKVTANPCLGMFVPPASPKRDRVLTNDEVRLVWKHTGSLGYPFGPLIRLLLLTGARRDEVAGIRKAELSEVKDGTDWLIPASRVKNKRDFLLPLSPQAADLLADTSKFAGGSDFIFTTTGKSAVSGFSKIKARLDKLMMEEAGSAFRPWRIHDLRRTVANGMASISIAPHEIEAVLNHVSGFRSGVAGTYNVYEYRPEKQKALRAWARHLDRLISGKSADVVPIRKGKRR